MSAQPEKGEAANVQGNPISKDQAQQNESHADKGQGGGSMYGYHLITRFQYVDNFSKRTQRTTKSNNVKR